MKKGEVIVAAALCGVAVFVFFYSNTIPLMVAIEKHSLVNAQFFPKLMSILLFILSTALILQNVYRWKTSRQQHTEETRTGRWGRLAAAVGLSILYLLALQPAGFFLSTLVLLFLLLWVLGTRSYALVLVPTLVPAAILVLFKFLLSVPLPRGIFFY